MTKFTVGSKYFMRSSCDHNCVWTYEVTKRTAKTITITDGDEKLNRRVRIYDGAERCNPLGTYSMCPSLSAERMVIS